MTRAGISRRAIPVALLAALAAGSVPAAAAAAGPTHAARLLSCHRSPQIDARVAAVAASMRPIAGGKRLQLRVDLYQRVAGAGRWTLRSDVPGLGSWTSPSDPTIGTRSADVFKYRQAVGRLAVPAAYRFRVAFRWLDAGGAIVQQATSTTRPCREPDLRPDLLIANVHTAPAPRAPNRIRYTLIVRNDGRTVARGVVLGATFAGEQPGAPARTRTVGRLRPHQTAAVTFVGPPCTAGMAAPTFAVDPSNVVDEADETNNQLVIACPA